MSVKPRIWKSRNGYWICHGNNLFGIPMQGYGNDPRTAWDHWFNCSLMFNAHISYINRL